MIIGDFGLASLPDDTRTKAVCIAADPHSQAAHSFSVDSTHGSSSTAEVPTGWPHSSCELRECPTAWWTYGVWGLLHGSCKHILTSSGLKERYLTTLASPSRLAGLPKPWGKAGRPLFANCPDQLNWEWLEKLHITEDCEYSANWFISAFPDSFVNRSPNLFRFLRRKLPRTLPRPRANGLQNSGRCRNQSMDSTWKHYQARWRDGGRRRRCR